MKQAKNMIMAIFIETKLDGFVKSPSAYVARHPQSLRRTLNVRLIPSDLADAYKIYSLCLGRFKFVSKSGKGETHV
jgi:hypothetical protein